MWDACMQYIVSLYVWCTSLLGSNLYGTDLHLAKMYVGKLVHKLVVENHPPPSQYTFEFFVLWANHLLRYL